MPWWIKELFSSTRFLLISGDTSFFESKRVYELVLPLTISCLIFGLYFVWPDLFIKDFLKTASKSIFQFMVFVVPFHLAALAAFSTFERPILEEKLKGSNVGIWVWSNRDQQRFWKTLTLRQYTSLLFGYLCTIGIVFIVVYILASILNFQFLSGVWVSLVHGVSVFFLIFFITHYALLSIYSITFLFEKLNNLSGTED